MNYDYRKLNPLKWMSIPLGLIMMGSVKDIIGIPAGLCCSIIAALVFYVMVNREQTRQAGLEFQSLVQAAKKKVGEIQSYVEVRKVRHGIIARVYIVGAKEQSSRLYGELVNGVEKSIIRDDIIAMQVADIKESASIGVARSRLNRQLMDEIRKNGEK